MGAIAEELHVELLAQMAWLRRLALDLVRDGATADDLVQDAWVAALDNRPRFDGSARPWLATVLRNLARSRGRRLQTRTRAAHLATDLDTGPCPESLSARHEIFAQVKALVDELDEPYRSTLSLRYDSGLEPQEIAERDGVPAGTVRWRLKRALDQIRAQLDQRHGGDRRRWAALLLGPALGEAPAAPRVAPFVLAPPLAGALAALTLLVLRPLLPYTDLGELAGDSGGALDRPLAGGSPWQQRPTTPDEAARSATGQPAAWSAQAGLPAQRIAGRVTFGGKPAAGARVVLARDLGQVPLLIAEVSSDADGRFDFGPRSASEYSLMAAAPGRANGTADLDLRHPDRRPEAGALELRLGACDNVVFGKVTDPAGAPIAGATIRERGLAGVVASTTGHYQLCSRGEESSLAIGAPGYGTAWADVEAVDGRLRLDIALLPQVTVSGLVLGAGGENPLTDALVTAEPPDRRRDGQTVAPALVVTDGNGRFRFEGLEPGRWTFSASASDAGPVGAVERVLIVGQAAGDVVLRLEPTVELRGRVLEGDSPVPGEEVLALERGTTEMRGAAITQADGSFVLSGVGRTAVALEVGSHDLVAPIEVDGGQAGPRDLVVRVRRRGGIFGRVFHAGAPSAGVQIDLEEEGLPVSSATSRGDGSFELPGLLSGNYRLRALSERHGAAAEPVTVTLSGSARLEANLHLQDLGIIAGAVVDDAGAPLPGVWVQLNPVSDEDHEEDAASCLTGTAGKFRCVVQTRGNSYQAEVSRHRFGSFLPPAVGGSHPAIPFPEPRAKVEGVELAVRFESGRITGRVLDASGSPLPETQVEAEADKGQGEAVMTTGGATAVTDGDGTFVLAGLPSGRWTLRAEAPNGELVSDRPGVATGSAGVVLRTQLPGSIVGRLDGFAGSVTVTILSQPDGDLRVAAREGATFSAQALRPGRYLVGADGHGAAARETVEVRSGQATQVTLASRGRGRLTARALQLGSRTPVRNLSCSLLVHPLLGEPLQPVGPEHGPMLTDEHGRFALDAVPAGEVEVRCSGSSVGSARATVPRDAQIDLEVIVVRARGGAARSFDGQLAEGQGGFVVTELHPEGKAERAGLRVGDVITGVGRVSTEGLGLVSFLDLAAQEASGGSVALTLVRAGRSQAASLPFKR